jgi:Phage tail protein (Tail_P2_I)
VSAPELTPWGERLRERTEPLAPDDEAHGHAHAQLAGALATALERVAQIYDPDDGPPGSPLVDVDRCPDWALPWLAQLIGVTLPADADPDTARILIGDVAGWRRGTPAALRAAAGLHLTGGKTVLFRERDPDAADPPYTLEVVTLDSQTPDPVAVQAELDRQKPAGIVLDYHVIAGWDYQEMTGRYLELGGDYATLEADYADYGDLTTNTEVP